MPNIPLITKRVTAMRRPQHSYRSCWSKGRSTPGTGGGRRHTTTWWRSCPVRQPWNLSAWTDPPTSSQMPSRRVSRPAAIRRRWTRLGAGRSYQKDLFRGGEEVEVPNRLGISGKKLENGTIQILSVRVKVYYLGRPTTPYPVIQSSKGQPLWQRLLSPGPDRGWSLGWRGTAPWRTGTAGRHCWPSPWTHWSYRRKVDRAHFTLVDLLSTVNYIIKVPKTKSALKSECPFLVWKLKGCCRDEEVGSMYPDSGAGQLVVYPEIIYLSYFKTRRSWSPPVHQFDCNWKKESGTLTGFLAGRPDFAKNTLIKSWSWTLVCCLVC